MASVDLADVINTGLILEKENKVQVLPLDVKIIQSNETFSMWLMYLVQLTSLNEDLHRQKHGGVKQNSVEFSHPVGRRQLSCQWNDNMTHSLHCVVALRKQEIC